MVNKWQVFIFFITLFIYHPAYVISGNEVNAPEANHVLIVSIGEFIAMEDYYADLHLGNFIHESLVELLFQFSVNKDIRIRHIMDNYFKNKVLRISEKQDNYDILFNGSYSIDPDGNYSFSLKKIDSYTIIAEMNQDFPCFSHLVYKILFEILAYDKDGKFYMEEEVGKTLSNLLKTYDEIQKIEKEIQQKIIEFSRVRQNKMGMVKESTGLLSDYFLPVSDYSYKEEIIISDDINKKRYSTIKGIIFDEVSGQRINNAIMETMPVTGSAMTNIKGEYVLGTISPGKYIVTVEAANYSHSSIVVNVGWDQLIQADIPMYPIPPYRNPFLATLFSLCIPGSGQLIITGETGWGIGYMLSAVLPAIILFADLFRADIYEPLGIHDHTVKSSLTITSGFVLAAIGITSGIHALCSAQRSNNIREGIIE
ncbi:MAG: carboxypeptidase regulatory-like domain-containing protein [Spirochaetales bacterium]|nr:carboxypeptidase regulatory-like domain-containing protein [Spirochaetales bacterium]